MLIFKEKGSKKKDKNVPINIDNKHHEIVKKFNENKLKNEETLSTIKNLNEKLDKLNKIPKNIITDEQLNERYELIDQIENLQRNCASNIVTNPNLYYTNTAHILYQYYNKCSEQQTIVENQTLVVNNVVQNNPLNKSILDFFKKNDNNNFHNISNNSTNDCVNIQKSIKENSKSYMLDLYMSYIDSRYVSDINKEEDIEMCKKCNAQKYFDNSEGLVVCQKCGEQEYVLIDCDKPSYKEPPREIAYFAYKRINHFNSWSGTAGILMVICGFFTIF
jgi:hypothetical protein